MNMLEEFYGVMHRFGILNHGSLEESGEAYFLSKYLAALDTPTVFDVGANIGAYSKAVLDACPSARIFAIEPHPVTFATLEGTLGNGRARVINAALGVENGSFELYDYRDDDGSSHASLHKGVIEELRRRPSVSHEVTVRRLDDLARELGVARIDLLKIDTEGNELAVLRGAESLIRAGAVDVVQFEFNEMNAISRTFFKDFWDFLPEYDFHRLLPGGNMRIHRYVPLFCEIFAFQTIVCAKKGMNIFG